MNTIFQARGVAGKLGYDCTEFYRLLNFKASHLSYRLYMHKKNLQILDTYDDTRGHPITTMANVHPGDLTYDVHIHYWHLLQSMNGRDYICYIYIYIYIYTHTHTHTQHTYITHTY